MRKNVLSVREELKKVRSERDNLQLNFVKQFHNLSFPLPEVKLVAQPKPASLSQAYSLSHMLPIPLKKINNSESKAKKM